MSEYKPGCDESDCPNTAETGCSFCPKLLCRNHAHVCNDKEVACYDCLINLGAPV